MPFVPKRAAIERIWSSLSGIGRGASIRKQARCRLCLAEPERVDIRGVFLKNFKTNYIRL